MAHISEQVVFWGWARTDSVEWVEFWGWKYGDPPGPSTEKTGSRYIRLSRPTPYRTSRPSKRYRPIL
jgi:hypothetical protein